MVQGERLPQQGSAWLGWDGRRLRWRLDAVDANCAEVELRLDGVIFERIQFVAATFERDFAFSPSGCEKIEFSLHGADGAPMVRSWRVHHGREARAGENQWDGPPPAMRPFADAALPPLAEWMKAPAVAIVIPIHNSPQCVQRCIESVLRWTQGPARLILIDDASSDPGIAPMLREHANREGVTVRCNSHNLGYTRTTNLGIELAGDNADVVLLNSDTEVGPRWLDRLRLTAYADETIGTVTAVSDNAGAFTVPELEQYCPIPSHWNLPQAQRALLQHAGGCLPEMPTGNGFCMFVKRALLDRVGVLDAEAFPFGYGEENDLCQRAEGAGYRHVIAGDVLVRHARSASFGAARRGMLGAQGMTVLRTRYPDYEDKVGASLCGFSRRALDYRVRRIYADADAIYTLRLPRPCVLLICVETNPGSTKRLAAAVLDQYDCFVLHGDGIRLCLSRYGSAGLEQQDDVAAVGDIETQLRIWLARYAIELVHILGAGVHGNAVPRAAAAMGVPVVEAPAAAPAAITALYRASWHAQASFAWDATAASLE